jgi:hypothetical protein
MDVVINAGIVRSGIVVSKDRHSIARSLGCLQDVGDEVGLLLMMFTDAIDGSCLIKVTRDSSKAMFCVAPPQD